MRPYLERYRDDAIKIMYGWAESPDEHLRRLASEGSRPRLPWATRVGWLMTPGPTLPLLDRLRDDPSEYVRRSVANHVNDLAKDHPQVALELLAGLARGRRLARRNGCCATRSAGCSEPAIPRPSPWWAPRRAAARWTSWPSARPPWPWAASWPSRSR
ncbi:hypothetical protein GCM10020220_038240 [Nonomuraea rubra]